LRDGAVDKITNDLFYIAANVADFGKLGGFDL